MKKIFIINDDQDFLHAIEILLKEFDYEPHIIHEGKHAYRKIKKEKPDLVILDIRLDSPVTGWKILDLVTLDPTTNRIPVIICTAVARFPEGKEGWLTEHGILVLPKPFDINDLIAMVEKALKPKSSHKVAVKEAN